MKKSCTASAISPNSKNESAVIEVAGTTHGVVAVAIAHSTKETEGGLTDQAGDHLRLRGDDSDPGTRMDVTPTCHEGDRQEGANIEEDNLAAAQTLGLMNPGGAHEAAAAPGAPREQAIALTGDRRSDPALHHNIAIMHEGNSPGNGNDLKHRIVHRQ